MSGPKTARYTLTEEQRRALEEQRRLQQQLKELSQKRNMLLEQAKDALDKLTPFANRESQLSELLNDDERSHMKIQAYMANCRNRIEGYQSSSAEDPDVLQADISAIEEMLGDMKRAAKEAGGEIERLSDRYYNRMLVDVGDAFELSFRGLGSQRGVKESPYIQKIRDSLGEISSLLLPQSFEQRLSHLKEEADKIESPDFLENFYSLQVQPFVKLCRAYEEYGETYNELLISCRCLAEELGIGTEEPVFSGEAIRVLQEEKQRLEQIIAEKQEQEYISQAIDEAMEEMGYRMIGKRSVSKRSGKKFSNRLYEFEEGTAVNVTYSSDGQISMELGAMDTADRTPTPEEASELAEDMQAFCTDYEKLEQKLIEKGIVARHMMRLPPTEEYAQIINVSEYDIEDGAQIACGTRTRRARTEKSVRHGEF